MTHETRAVLAGAYIQRRGHVERPTLTHTLQSRAGEPYRVLCGRVSVEHLADTYAADPGSAPTCARCRRRDPRFTKENP